VTVSANMVQFSVIHCLNPTSTTANLSCTERVSLHNEIALLAGTKLYWLVTEAHRCK